MDRWIYADHEHIHCELEEEPKLIERMVAAVVRDDGSYDHYGLANGIEDTFFKIELDGGTLSVSALDKVVVTYAPAGWLRTEQIFPRPNP